MKFKLGAILLLGTVVSACSSNSESDSQAGGIAVATIASDYKSSSHASIANIDGEFQVSSNLLPSQTSDLTVASGGKYFYRIERGFAGNNITKLAFSAPQDVIWQYSVRDDPEEAVAANPHDLIVVSETKAYVIRRGKDKVWIVNPSATLEENFKIGELDLSSYNDSDGKPEMVTGVIVNEKLFILMQRLVNAMPTEIAYVAVFDIETEMEIETDYPGDLVKGIPLEARNPGGNMMYVKEDNSIYISAVGSYGSPGYTGGIEKIDVDTYESKLVFDDGTDNDHPYGKVVGATVVSPTQAYFIGCADCVIGSGNFSDYSLYKLDPGTGIASVIEVAELQNTILTSLALSPEGDLWISANDATLYVFDTAQDGIVETLDTFLNPNKVVFEW